MNYIELTDAIDREIFNGVWTNVFKKHNRYIELVEEIRATCDKDKAYEIEKARVGEDVAKKRIHVLFETELQEKL